MSKKYHGNWWRGQEVEEANKMVREFAQVQSGGDEGFTVVERKYQVYYALLGLLTTRQYLLWSLTFLCLTLESDYLRFE